MVIRPKKQKNGCPEEIEKGDGWIGVSLAQASGLILSARVGKHTDAFITELIDSPAGKTDCELWYTDGWAGYERDFTPEVTHVIGKENTQRLERTNGIIRQQTGRWHRRQNKFGKRWHQTKVATRLVVSYFNWIWQHSRTGDSAAMRAGLATKLWVWHDVATYPTFY